MDTKAPSVPAPNVFLRDTFGGDFEQAEAVVAVGTVPTLLVPNDPEAVNLTVVNNSANQVWLAPNNQVSASLGIQLNPGGSASIIVRDDATLPTREWWAIASAGPSNVYYLRLRRYITVAQVG